MAGDNYLTKEESGWLEAVATFLVKQIDRNSSDELRQTPHLSAQRSFTLHVEHQEAVGIIKTQIGDANDATERARMHAFLGHLQLLRFRPEYALKHYNEAFDARREVSYTCLAGRCHLELGQYNEAADAFMAGLYLKQGHGARLSDCVIGLGSALSENYQLEEAYHLLAPLVGTEHVGDDALNRYRAFLIVGGVTNALAGIQPILSEEIYSEALGYIRRAEDVAIEYGLPDDLVALAKNNLAEVLKVTDELDDALENLMEAEAILEGRYLELYPKFPGLARVYNNLGAFYHVELNDLSRAKKYYSQTLGILRAHFGNAHKMVAITYKNLAELEIELGQIGDGEELARKALRVAEKSLPEDHPVRIAIEKECGNLLAR